MINIQQLSRACTVKTFKPGNVIFSENDTKYDDMAVILSGQAQAYTNYGKPQQATYAQYTVGSTTGEESLFLKKSRSITVVAISECSVMLVTASTFKNLSLQIPDTVFSICASMCKKTSEANEKIAQLTKEKEYLSEKSGINILQMYKSFLYPENHGDYPAVQPPEYDAHTILGKFTCPVCGETFSLHKSLLSTVVITKTTDEGRLIAKDFEPLWYDFTVCPKCYYSCATSFFENKGIINRAVVNENLTTIRNNLKFDFTRRKTLDDVFASFYLGILCAEGLTNKRQVIAKAWLGLSWLYDDLKETQMYDFATQKAFEAYKTFYVDSAMDEENAIKVCLTLVALAIKTERLDEAYAFLAKVIIKRDLKPAYRRVAEDMKELIKQKREAM